MMRIEKLNRLSDILEESVAKQEIAGGNLCVIHKGREVYYAQAGYANIVEKKKMERNTIVRLYSMTKPVTAAAVMLLVERGMIDLWDPIEKYIPEFANISVTADSREDIGAIKAKRSITIKDCMNMTSGLPYGDDMDIASRDVGNVFQELDKRLYSANPMTTREFAGKEILAARTVEYLTSCHLQPHQQAMMKDWENLYGFSYGNLMRVLVKPSLTIMNGSIGEYGWDGWLGAYFANMPKEETTFLMMVQRKDSGTFTLTRKLRNALATTLE